MTPSDPLPAAESAEHLRDLSQAYRDGDDLVGCLLLGISAVLLLCIVALGVVLWVTRPVW